MQNDSLFDGTVNRIEAGKSSALALLNPSELAPAPGSPEYREHVERGATELARVFREATGKIRAAWEVIAEQCELLSDTMRPVDEFHWHNPFDVTLYSNGRRHYDYQDRRAIDAVLKEFNVKAWSLLIDRMGIRNLMSIMKREEFDKQVEKGDVPEVTAENILGVLTGLADRAADFATEAARETLGLLTPSSGHYKTNSGFKVGKRVVLSWYVERGYGGGFRANHYREAHLNSIDATFHLLDGKGIIRGRKSPLIAAIEASGDGVGETEYFRFRACKNRNLHLEFRRLDLVKKLNGLATGEFVLGRDET
jgi:hypothetical protein